MFRSLFSHSPRPAQQAEPISRNLKTNLTIIERTFANAHDLIVCEFTVGSPPFDVALACIKGLADKEAINEHIIHSLMKEARFQMQPGEAGATDFLSYLKRHVVSIAEIRDLQTIPEALDGVLEGGTVLFVQGSNSALLAGTQGFEKRPISEPETEVVV
ncbi:MAG: spore germination protein [Clostridia bacterium]|nr:spore germination protein [Clostridia bacterium]